MTRRRYQNDLDLLLIICRAVIERQIHRIQLEGEVFKAHITKIGCI